MKKLVIFDLDGTLFSMRLSSRHDAPLDDRTVLPGVKAKIAELQKVGVLIGIATNQQRGKWGGRVYNREIVQERLEDVCWFFDLDPSLVRYVFVDTWAAKPNPIMLTHLRRTLHLETEDVLFVGDSECDHQAAARAHVAFEWAWDYFDGWNNGQKDHCLDWENWEDDLWRK